MAVLLLAALLLFVRLGDRSLWGPESRWAEIAREMRVTENYFWPTLNGRVYYDKPLLSYWLITAAAYFRGGLDEVALRLPGALAGLLGVALSMVLTRQIYDDRTAILAGLVLATCYQYIFWSRIASADIETVTGVLATVTLFFRNKERPNAWWIPGPWVIMALTSLVKGLQGFALPLLIVGVYSLLADGWRNLAENALHGRFEKRVAWLISQSGWFFNRKALLALVIAGVVYALPFAMSFAVTGSNVGLDKVFYENLVRFFQPFDHKEPFYIYIYALFSLMVPWCVFLPAALVHAHSKPLEKSDRFVLVYFWVTFIFFTLSGSRRDYYLLPILPPAAILVAHLFTTGQAGGGRHVRRLTNAGYILLSVTVAAILVASTLILFLPAARPASLNALWAAVERIAFVGCWTFLVMLIATIFPFLKWRPERLAVSATIAAYLFVLFIVGFALPNGETFRVEKAFAQSVRLTLNGDMNGVVLYNRDRPMLGLIFYLSANKPLSEVNNYSDLAVHIKKNSVTWVIASEKDLPKLPVDGSVLVRAQRLAWSRSKLDDGYVLIRVIGDVEKNKTARIESSP